MKHVLDQELAAVFMAKLDFIEEQMFELAQVLSLINPVFYTTLLEKSGSPGFMPLGQSLRAAAGRLLVALNR